MLVEQRTHAHHPGKWRDHLVRYYRFEIAALN